MVSLWRGPVGLRSAYLVCLCMANRMQILMLTCFRIIVAASLYVYLNTFKFFSRYERASPRHDHLPVPAGLCLFQMDLGPVPGRPCKNLM